MCGIVAVLTAHNPGVVDLSGLPERIDALAARLPAPDVRSDEVIDGLGEVAAGLEEVVGLLRGGPGVRALVRDPSTAAALGRALGPVEERVAAVASGLDLSAITRSAGLDQLDGAIARVRDAAWTIRCDVLASAGAISDLSPPGAADATIDAYGAIQIALSALDRLEVRGRDSAGIHVIVSGHGLELDSADVKDRIDKRSDELFRSGTVRRSGDNLAFVYKVAAEIGELGDNTKALRAAVRADDLLAEALSTDACRVNVLGHTRWASVGLITEANAHPLDETEASRSAAPCIVGALNGDIDNHVALREAEAITVRDEITTDAKLIPALFARRLSSNADAEEAFRATVDLLEGSVAIGAASAGDPDRMFLALRGSGQALYIGLANDAFVVTSEPYGLVEQTSSYVRLDGESPSRSGRLGQVAVLDRTRAGTIDGIRRRSYDGTDVPVTQEDVRTAEITTRDIDRTGFPHFLIKEIGQSPASVRKTLRAKIGESDGLLTARLPDEALPIAIRQKLQSGAVRRIIVIGQGTAAIAGQAVAIALRRTIAASGIDVRAMPSSELSGFELDDDMSDVLIVAISQSGTTVDTNRTVDLARARGAAVIGLVNRRNSDLVVKSDGVLYTSDGRDQEMAVPSTKAFYAQVVAGFVLAAALAEPTGCVDPRTTHDLLDALRKLPDAMELVLAKREQIAEAARRHGPPRRSWTVVGNGPNRVAAEELRIKMSELCYKAMSVDWTEDKKHIDISSEPLIFVCAAGLSGPTAEDVAKEVEYYRAHKAAPIAVVTEGERIDAAYELIEVPKTHPDLAFLLSTLVGHIFGYEAAVAIDAQARTLREFRGAIEAAVGSSSEDQLLERVEDALSPLAPRFFDELRGGAYNGHLEADVAVRLASLLRYATGVVPLESFAVEHGKRAAPGQVVSELLDALSDGVDQLTRTIDSIKHQAKTVTVGITRSEEAYFAPWLVRSVLEAGAPRDRLSYKALRALGALSDAAREVNGYTRYRIEGDVEETATIHVVDKGGIATDIQSRVERNPILRGTKRRTAAEREVTVARGLSDGRVVLLVPEQKDGHVTGMTLLHVAFADRLEAADARRVLSAYRGRYQAIVDAVSETEPSFDDAVLAEVGFADLLVRPVHVLAEHWRARREP